MLDLSHSTVMVWNNPNVFECESCGATGCSTCVSNNAILCLSCFELAKKIATPAQYIRNRELGVNYRERNKEIVYYLNEISDPNFVYLSPNHPFRKEFVVNDSGKVSRSFFYTVCHFMPFLN